MKGILRRTVASEKFITALRNRGRRVLCEDGPEHRVASKFRSGDPRQLPRRRRNDHTLDTLGEGEGNVIIPYNKR